MKKTALSDPCGIFFTTAETNLKAVHAAVFEQRGNNCSKVPKYIYRYIYIYLYIYIQACLPVH